MPKICKHADCHSQVFSKGECKYHAQIRYVKERQARQQEKQAGKVNTKQYKPIRKVSKQHVANKLAERAVMLKKWKASLQQFSNYEAALCENCSKHLTHFEPIHLAHVISKGAMPQARCDIDNIVIVCIECHQAMDFQNAAGQTRNDLSKTFLDKLTGITNAMKSKYT